MNQPPADLWPVFRILLACAFVLATPAVLYRWSPAVRRWLKGGEESPAKAAAEEGTSESAPPSPVPAQAVDTRPAQPPARKLTARERVREEAYTAQQATGQCLHCQMPATEPHPVYEPVRTLVDLVRHYFNRPVTQRRRVSPRPDTGWWAQNTTGEAPKRFCSLHHTSAVALMSARLARAEAKLVEANAEFAHGVAEYEQFGLFEDMAADAEAAAERRAGKQRKPPPAAVPEGKVLSIARANGDG